MSSKRYCAVCGKDLTRRNYAQVVMAGKIVKICPTGNCAKEVLGNEKNTRDVNRMCNSRNVHSR